MVGIEEIAAYKDIGIGAIALVIIYNFAKWTSDKALTQIEEANKRAAESQNRFSSFLETSYRENTRVMSELVSSIKEHVKIKEEALELLKEQQDMLRRRVPKEYR